MSWPFSDARRLELEAQPSTTYIVTHSWHPATKSVSDLSLLNSIGRNGLAFDIRFYQFQQWDTQELQKLTHLLSVLTNPCGQVALLSQLDKWRNLVTVTWLQWWRSPSWEVSSPTSELNTSHYTSTQLLQNPSFKYNKVSPFQYRSFPIISEEVYKSHTAYVTLHTHTGTLPMTKAKGWCPDQLCEYWRQCRW